jgi:CRISPR-associated protein Cas2
MLMGRENRYKGILKPLQVGAPRGESPLVLLYDIEDDKVRNRVSEICLDYGLERIQFSAFFGRLTRNRRQEMALRVRREVEDENARVRVIPVAEEDLADMWEYDHWRMDADELKKQAEEGERPRLKRVGGEE